MSTQTDNYGFVKPARTEKYMVAVFNANMDTIDGLLKQIADSSGGDVPDNVVTTDDVATITQAGIIKLYNSGGTNRSGLLVQADGALLVNTNPAYGTQRTGDGKLTTAGATEAEIDAGTNEYKPITPATIQYAVEKYAPGGGGGGITEVNTDDIVDKAVTQPKIADGAVGTGQMADDSVTQSKLAQAAVGTDQMADRSVTADKLGTNAVTASSIAANAVGTNQIADASVTAKKLADGAKWAEYPEIVTRVGTWNGDATGTPVWRKCVERSFTTGEAYNGTITLTKLNAGRVLDVQLWYISGTTWDTAHPMYNSSSGDEAGWYLDMSSVGVRIPAGYAANRIYGYIDFITDEDNVYTS